MSSVNKDALMRSVELTEKEVDALTAEVEKLKWETYLALQKAQSTTITDDSITFKNGMGMQMTENAIVITKDGEQAGSITY